MDNYFSILSAVIKQRRSIKPTKMNGNLIPDHQVQQLIELADWAPTHGQTEPWRFIVYSGNSVKFFCRQHAELYRENIVPPDFIQAKYDKILHNGDKASHIIIAIMRRGGLPKVPVLEEAAAVSAAIQNILLGATALGIASFWSTGIIAHHDAMKHYLQLREEDIVMGILFLGYADPLPEGKRIIPLSEKVKWEKDDL